jgi:hypothetical protein
MNNLIKITDTESIGDSLSSVNLNYELLDNLITNIQFSAINYWIPIATFYESRKDFWKINALDTAKYFVNWQTTSTIFETNSAKWITPLIIWYPFLINLKDYQKNPNKITTDFKTWLDTKYPVLNDKGIPIYLQTQIMTVYAFTYGEDPTISQTIVQTDSTTCTTQDGKACASCSKTYHGGNVDCDNGDFSCGGTFKDQKCVSVSCSFDLDFPDANGKPVKSKSKYSQIHASLNVNYKNKYEESTIIALNFKVNNCGWEFSSILTT